MTSKTDGVSVAGGIQIMNDSADIRVLVSYRTFESPYTSGYGHHSPIVHPVGMDTRVNNSWIIQFLQHLLSP